MTKTEIQNCPTHKREHQPRERLVKCGLCLQPTWDFHGTHPFCMDRQEDMLDDIAAKVAR